MPSDLLSDGIGDDEDASADDGDGVDYVDDGIQGSSWQPVHDWLPAATFDVLFLVDSLGQQSPPGPTELHTFAYLACLLSVYKGHPASDWGYAFTAVPPTLPYSPAMDSAISTLMASGRVEAQADTEPSGSLSLRMTVVGRDDLKFLGALEAFEPRADFLRAAARTPLFTSLPAVVNSMGFEPQLAQALQLNSSRMLLTEVTTGLLYREFDALLAALGPADRDLLVPAALYVRYLQERARQNLADASAGTADDE